MTYKYSLNDVMELAEKKVGIEGWIGYSWKRCGSDSIVTGDVPIGLFKSGQRKGKPRFRGPGRTVIVTNVEMQATAATYESETGNCWDCHGSGQIAIGWSQTDGKRYTTCTRCGGSGVKS
jgi:hypothetical protein